MDQPCRGATTYAMEPRTPRTLCSRYPPLPRPCARALDPIRVTLRPVAAPWRRGTGLVWAPKKVRVRREAWQRVGRGWPAEAGLAGSGTGKRSASSANSSMAVGSESVWVTPGLRPACPAPPRFSRPQRVGAGRGGARPRGSTRIPAFRGGGPG